MEISVRIGSIDEVVLLSRSLPEFIDPHGKDEYEKRLRKNSLILIAEVDNQNAGFKVGYDRFQDNIRFYSWMGGVLPDYRKLGVASRLQEEMEKWCLEKGYSKLVFKTMNKHRSMIHFAIKNDFVLVDFERREDLMLSRLIFEKDLRPA